MNTYTVSVQGDRKGGYILNKLSLETIPFYAVFLQHTLDGFHTITRGILFYTRFNQWSYKKLEDTKKTVKVFPLSKEEILEIQPDLDFLLK